MIKETMFITNFSVFSRHKIVEIIPIIKKKESFVDNIFFF